MTLEDYFADAEFDEDKGKEHVFVETLINALPKDGDGKLDSVRCAELLREQIDGVIANQGLTVGDETGKFLRKLTGDFLAEKAEKTSLPTSIMISAIMRSRLSEKVLGVLDAFYK